MDLKITVSIDTDDESYQNMPDMIAREVAHQLMYQPAFRDALTKADQEIGKAKQKIIDGLKGEVTKYDLTTVLASFQTRFGESLKSEIKSELAKLLMLHFKTDKEFIMQVALTLAGLVNKAE